MQAGEHLMYSSSMQIILFNLEVLRLSRIERAHAARARMHVRAREKKLHRVETKSRQPEARGGGYPAWGIALWVVSVPFFGRVFFTAVRISCQLLL